MGSSWSTPRCAYGHPVFGVRCQMCDNFEGEKFQREKFERETELRKQEIASSERVRIAEIGARDKREQREFELRKAGYEEKIARAKAEAETKAKELEAQRKEVAEQHRKEIEEFQRKGEEERQAHVKLMQSKNVEFLLEHHTYLIDSRSKLLPILLKQQSVSIAKLRTLRALQLQLMTEQCRLEAFSDERDDDSVLRVVLYGPTGHGKSTFSNRVSGDRSAEGDKGEFSVGHDPWSLTSDIKKFVIRDMYHDKHGRPITISVTDQPGRGDSEGRDRQFANNLVEYLRGIEFVNAFILVKTMMPKRWDEHFQVMLNELVDMVGTKVWNHVIVVLTHAGTGKCTKKYMNNVRDLLSRKVDMGDFDVSRLPIIPIELYETEAGEHTYEAVINSIVTKLVPKRGRFSCEGLVSPIDTLANEVDEAELEYENEKLAWRGHLATDRQYAKQIQEISTKLKSLDASFVIDETAFRYPRDGVKLSLDEDIPEPDKTEVLNDWLVVGDDEKSDDDDCDLEAHPTWRCKRCTHEGNTSGNCAGCDGAFDAFGEVVEVPMWQCTECTMMNDEEDDECSSCFAERGVPEL